MQIWQETNFFHLELSMNTHVIYNAETVEKIVNTMQKMKTKTTWNSEILQLDLIVGIIGIYQKKELHIMQ